MLPEPAADFPDPLRLALEQASTSAMPVRSLYIHVPFCAHRCHYCDFYSIVDTRDRAPAFVNRLIDELHALAPAAAGRPLETIFVGGGTPTLLPVHLWEKLLVELDQCFDLSMIRSGGGEWTVECNPETASDELFGLLAAHGVNRLSLGAQSFDQSLLDRLDRTHDPANVARAIRLARAAGIERLSADLIFAIPGQTLDQWHADLRAALDLGTTHISAYALTYEPNTPLTARLRRGEFEPAAETLEIEMFRTAGDVLAAHGLERYEVSNFAAPGDECRHNLAYWRQDSWLAAGPSASGHLRCGGVSAGSHRWKNTPRLDSYLHHPRPHGAWSPVSDHEPPEPRRLLAETVMTGLRLKEGLDAAALRANAEQLGVGAPVERALESAMGLGHLEEAAKCFRLTADGLLLADGIASDIMAAILE